MKPITSFLKEIFPVVIGILIALLINNWNEDRKDERYLEEIYSAIQRELKESSDDINRVLPMQLASVDTLVKYMNDDKASLFEVMVRANGIQLPRIRTNAWNAISRSKIELIEYEKLSALADIEERKENLRVRSEKQVEFIFQNFESTERSKKTVLHMLMLDIINAEQELAADIDKLIVD